MLVRFPRVVAPVKLAQICGVGHNQSLCLHRARPREGRTDKERESEWQRTGEFWLVLFFCMFTLSFVVGLFAAGID